MFLFAFFIKIRLFGDLELKEILFLLFAFASMVGAGVISIIRISKTETSDPEMTFCILLLVNLGNFF